jgi:hypothetical protein
VSLIASEQASKGVTTNEEYRFSRRWVCRWLPGPAQGADVDQQGYGTVSEPRMYQLIRQTKPIGDRTFTINFLNSDGEAFCFTFG